MEYALAVSAIVLSAAELVALIGVLGRHAIPRAPFLFHGLLLVPMLLASLTALATGWIALAPGDELFSVREITWRTVHFAAQAVVFTVLNIYAFYHHVRITRENGQ